MKEESKGKSKSSKAKKLSESKLLAKAVMAFSQRAVEQSREQTFSATTTLGARGSGIMALLGTTTTSSMRLADICVFYPEVTEASIRQSVKLLRDRGLVKSSTPTAGRPTEPCVISLTAAGKALLKRATAGDATVLLTGAPLRR